MLRDSAVVLEHEIVPEVRRFARQWRKTTLLLDALVFGSLLLVLFVLTVWPGYLDGQALKSTVGKLFDQNRYVVFAAAGLVLLAGGYLHYRLRRRAAAWVIRKRLARFSDPIITANYTRAYRKNSSWYRSIFFRRPNGWSRRNRRQLTRLLEGADAAIGRLNDAFTSPSGAPVTQNGDSPGAEVENGGAEESVDGVQAGSDGEKAGADRAEAAVAGASDSSGEGKSGAENPSST